MQLKSKPVLDQMNRNQVPLNNKKEEEATTEVKSFMYQEVLVSAKIKDMLSFLKIWPPLSDRTSKCSEPEIIY